MHESTIRQLYPELDVSGDLALEYGLDNPEFYSSIVENKNYYYFIFGYIVSALLAIVYLFKILCTVPQTEDTGEIIAHILLLKATAMVIYPTLGGYVNYCKGFTLLDFPWANEALSSAISNPADTAPPVFYHFL